MLLTLASSVALQREEKRRTILSPNDPSSASRRSVFWTNEDPNSELARAAEEKAKKKKSGLIKWWRKVTGSNNPDAHLRNMPMEDDLPLAPPPPLSYLVSRGSAGDLSNSRQSASASPPVSSPKFGQTITAPSPTSPTYPRGEAEPSGVRTVINEQEKQPEKTDEGAGKGSSDWKVHSTASEPNLRQAANQPQLTPPVPQLPETVGGSRRPSIVGGVSREKSLPPLPLDEPPAQINPGERPMTMYSYDPRGALPPGTRPPHDFLPPNPAFRSGADSRRQSFGGLGSRPELAIQTLPANQGNGYSIRQSYHPQYDEFGNSQGEYYNTVSTPKRKSKFGFGSLLTGKKGGQKEHEIGAGQAGGQPFPTMSGRWDDSTARMSIASRKPLDELVTQDPQFKAYRYPSGDQQFDFLK